MSGSEQIIQLARIGARGNITGEVKGPPTAKLVEIEVYATQQRNPGRMHGNSQRHTSQRGVT